jgi:tetratricopeptide (TPR) repeat protein
VSDRSKEASRRGGGSATRSRPPRRAEAAWICAGLVVAAVVLYGPTLRHGFVSLDDEAYVEGNSHVRNGLTLDGVKWAFGATYQENWHPLTWISHMADVSVSGLAPGGHHLTGLVLHALNGVLLFLALRALTRDTWPSALAAALFVAHPLHVESVAWIAERKDVLSGFFWMLTLLAYARYARRPESRGAYAAVLASFALGLLAKPMLVTLPFVLLLLDWWPLGRTPAVREKAPLFALSAASSIVTYVAQAKGGVVGTWEAVPIGDRLANACVAYVSYLAKTIWPAGLSVYYTFRKIPPATGLLAGAILVAATIAILRLGLRGRPWLAVGWLWYLGTLVPVIGIVQIGRQAMADRYTYLPLVGIFLAIAWTLRELVARRPSWRVAAVATMACVLLALCAVTRAQVTVWRDSRTLFEHALALDPGNYLAHNGLGVVLVREGDVTGAISHLEEALRAAPDYMHAHNNLAGALVRAGRFAEAAEHLRAALRLVPNDAMAHYNLGLVLDQLGRREEAQVQYREALRLEPGLSEAAARLSGGGH